MTVVKKIFNPNHGRKSHIEPSAVKSRSLHVYMLGWGIPSRNSPLPPILWDSRGTILVQSLRVARLSRNRAMPSPHTFFACVVVFVREIPRPSWGSLGIMTKGLQAAEHAHLVEITFTE